MSPNDLLASIRPINPAAFGPVKQQMPPQGMPPQNPEAEKMTNYLMNKVEEIKQRLGQGDVGALSNVTEAMRG